MTSDQWTMPDWMEPYRDLIVNTGGNPVEDLMNDTTSNLFNNGIRAALCVAIKSQVVLLCSLHARGLLPPAAGADAPGAEDEFPA